MEELNTSVEEFVLRDDSSNRLDVLFNTKERRSLGADTIWTQSETQKISSPKIEKTPGKSSQYFDIYAEDLSIYDEIKQRTISVSIDIFEDKLLRQPKPKSFQDFVDEI